MTLGEALDRAGRAFARAVTTTVVRRPALWRLFRRPMRAQFDRLARVWEQRGGPEALVPLGAALERIDGPPARVLDVGAGTGKAARVVARVFPQAEVVGVDLSPEMVKEARRLLPPELAQRVRFEVADAAALPFADGAFDLVVLLNMIPFFEELARVTAPGGTAAFVFSWGPETPIFVPAETLRGRLEPLGFERIEELRAGQGIAVLARLRGPESG